MTELQLAELGYSDTIIFRPGALGNAERPGDFRPLETVLQSVHNSCQQALISDQNPSL